LGRTTTEEHIDTAVATLAHALSRLRKVAGTAPVA
jgi:cysteine sulfinate desulfinase/cysteine desulfurase-like protein